VVNEADNDSQALDCTNPSHAQDGIIESSVCQSGAISENHQGVYATEAMIFSPPGQRHRITVSNREPPLMAYAWMGHQGQTCRSENGVLVNGLVLLTSTVCAWSSTNHGNSKRLEL
jgi:hypothetical protein